MQRHTPCMQVKTSHSKRTRRNPARRQTSDDSAIIQVNGQGHFSPQADKFCKASPPKSPKAKWGHFGFRRAQGTYMEIKGLGLPRPRSSGAAWTLTHSIFWLKHQPCTHMEGARPHARPQTKLPSRPDLCPPGLQHPRHEKDPMSRALGNASRGLPWRLSGGARLPTQEA